VPPLCWIGAISVAAISNEAAHQGPRSMSRRGSRISATTIPTSRLPEDDPRPAALLESWRGEQETEAVERWKEEAGRNARASSGWGPTLEAASDGRVDLLLFQEGVDHEAWECPACGRVGIEGGACPLDGTQMEHRDDGLDLAVHQTLAHGGTVLAMRQRQDLEPVEGIGALLRF